MARSLALLALSSAAMAAQSTTVSLLLPVDPRKLVGSVIGVDSAATTYACGCAPGVAADECFFKSSQTITQGPTTYIHTDTYSDADGVHYTADVHCKLSSAVDWISCSMSMTTTDSTGSITIITSADTASDWVSFQLPVTITAGLEKLQAAPGASATDSSAAAAATNSNTGASETSQTTAAASSGANTSKSASSGPASTAASSSGGSTTLARQTTAAVSTGTSNSSTAAAPNSTNAAGLLNAQNGLLAGVAALVGGVMML
ncbi:HFBs protein [Trichoderma simmonsii]|uniref:HFBs protein n=1 Tax=Trichoderma simmonsii TaxID=1491479 RepID=A0A8G0L5P8_9HYPO|nr:HFBs protein [Trichoderma simmonsii]